MLWPADLYSMLHQVLGSQWNLWAVVLLSILNLKGDERCDEKEGRGLYCSCSGCVSGHITASY